jgi:small ligand-binding sensory domain FIST
MGEDQSETKAAIYRLKEEIHSLSEQQAEALKTATFVGMTSDEVIEYDRRGEKITEMIRQLKLLQKDSMRSTMGS